MEQITSTGVQKDEGLESLHQVCWAQVDRVSEIAATITKLESRSSVESSKLYWMYREEAYKIDRDHGYSLCDLFIKTGVTKQTQHYFRIWERKMELNWKAIFGPVKKYKSKVELESEEEKQEQEKEQEQELEQEQEQELAQEQEQEQEQVQVQEQVVEHKKDEGVGLKRAVATAADRGQQQEPPPDPPPHIVLRMSAPYTTAECRGKISNLSNGLCDTSGGEATLCLQDCGKTAVNSQRYVCSTSCSMLPTYGMSTARNTPDPATCDAANATAAVAPASGYLTQPHQLSEASRKGQQSFTPSRWERLNKEEEEVLQVEGEHEDDRVEDDRVEQGEAVDGAVSAQEDFVAFVISEAEQYKEEDKVLQAEGEHEDDGVEDDRVEDDRVEDDDEEYYDALDVASNIHHGSLDQDKRYWSSEDEDVD